MGSKLKSAVQFPTFGEFINGCIHHGVKKVQMEGFMGIMDDNLFADVVVAGEWEEGRYLEWKVTVAMRKVQEALTLTNVQNELTVAMENIYKLLLNEMKLDVGLTVDHFNMYLRGYHKRIDAF